MESPRHDALRTHYQQIATSIGLGWLDSYLSAVLSGACSTSLQKRTFESQRNHQPRVLVRGEGYLGTIYENSMVRGATLRQGSIQNAPSIFFGIASSVISDLLSNDLRDLDRLLERTGAEVFSFQLTRASAIYTGLTDGVLRIDFTTTGRPEETHLDVFDGDK